MAAWAMAKCTASYNHCVLMGQRNQDGRQSIVEACHSSRSNDQSVASEHPEQPREAMKWLVRSSKSLNEEMPLN
jgi:hypothetical protein